ncbi:HET-domain-containing protein [Apiospora arundinis]|uniref:HET-domain-containing protein n=1 Tax=Apiospora arundinis TaxID=335852 RepID=A0ABR2IGP4_9PEZI
MDAVRLEGNTQSRESLCAVCEVIDWSEVSKRTHDAGSDGLPVRKFSTADSQQNLRLSKCQICRALATIKSGKLDGKPGGCTLVSVWSSHLERYEGIFDCYLILYVSESWPLPDNGYNRFGFLAVFETGVAAHCDANISQQPADANPGLSSIMGSDSRPKHATQPVERILPRDDGSMRLLEERPNFLYIQQVEKICRSEHPSCQRPSSSQPDLPLRVINCHTKEVIDAPVGSDYLALSYVWGDTTKTVGDPQSNEPALPPVVLDSIEVTLALNHDYLWVDRYCIDHSGPYKDYIIGRMNEVYAQAAIVIIATTGDSADDGLPGISTRREAALETTIGSFTFRQIPACSPLQFLIDRVSWLSRGWTYQEGYLSRRRLFFSKTQTLFVCDSMVFPESMAFGFLLKDSEWGRSGLVRRPGLPNQTEGCQQDFREDYHNLRDNILQFSNRKLTFDDDSLRAFMGVLNDHKHGVTRQHHLWGLPISPAEGLHMPPRIALGWTHGCSMAQWRRPSLPSWSWVGWAGATHLPWDPDVDLSMVYLKPEQKEPLGAVYSSLTTSQDQPRRLYLRSAVTEVTFIPEDTVRPTGDDVRRCWREPRMFAVLPVTETAHMVVSAFVDDDIELWKSYSSVILSDENETDEDGLLPSGKQRAKLLVLRTVDGHFERVGIVKTGSIGLDDEEPMHYEVSSADISNKIVNLKPTKGPGPVMEQLWRQKAKQQTICLS